MRQPSAADDFFFDLNGYLVLENAVEPDLLAALDAEFDGFPRDLKLGHWHRGAQRRDYNARTGVELHHCLEIGEPFEPLIDHPSWINFVRHYCGEEKSYVEGLFIDECIASVRQAGGLHSMHSGGFQGALRGAYHHSNGVFRCGQVNIIVALTDIGEGDGATLVVPASHKSNLPYPANPEMRGAIAVPMKKGDALLFVDGLMHGGSERTNAGERRIIILRYGPLWGATRFGYQYSPELLARLTPARRKILQPISPILPGDTRLPQEK